MNGHQSGAVCVRLKLNGVQPSSRARARDAASKKVMEGVGALCAAVDLDRQVVDEEKVILTAAEAEIQSMLTPDAAGGSTVHQAVLAAALEQSSSKRLDLVMQQQQLRHTLLDCIQLAKSRSRNAAAASPAPPLP